MVDILRGLKSRFILPLNTRPEVRLLFGNLKIET